MRRMVGSVITFVVCAVLLGIVGCSAADDEAETTSNGRESIEATFTVTTPAFAQDATIPTMYAREGAGGDNVSWPCTWENAPEGTRSFALLLMDLHPVARRWVHWTVVDIPADVTSIEEDASGTGELPAGARELPNTWGEATYGGPQPPEGSGAHEYRLTVYALDVETLDVADDADLRAFLGAIEDHILAETSVSGTFGN